MLDYQQRRQILDKIILSNKESKSSIISSNAYAEIVMAGILDKNDITNLTAGEMRSKYRFKVVRIETVDKLIDEILPVE